ncbi:MAG: hypothetical protein ACK4GN_00755, partial [Runella sp.]
MKKRILTVGALLLAIASYAQTNTSTVVQNGTAGTMSISQTIVPGSAVGNNVVAVDEAGGTGNTITVEQTGGDNYGFVVTNGFTVGGGNTTDLTQTS